MEAETHNCAIDVKELILTQSGKSMGAETFVYEPANIEEEAFGNLYIIGWMQNRRHDLEFLPNLIASVIRREFYAVDGHTAETHFASALKKANATLLDINKENKDVIRDVHFCIANIVGKKIRVCLFGDMVATICRNGAVAAMDQRGKRRGKTELFSDVITGDIAPGDTILLGTKQVIDLFSDKGLKKLLTLPLLEQSDIITKIYQKNAQEALLPDQALVLIGVTDVSGPRWLPFKKNPGEKKHGDAFPAAHERAIAAFAAATRKTHATGASLAAHARAIPTLSVQKRNARIYFGIFACIILAGSIYAMIHAQIIALRGLEQQIAAARATADPIAATTMLTAVQRDAIARMPSLFTTSAAQHIFQTANEELNALHGIRITHPVLIAQRRTSAFSFQPAHIFDGGTMLYIFADTPNMILKIEKNKHDQRFAFLSGNYADFPAERMLEKNGDFYFINNTKKTAVLWRPADNTLTTAQWLREKSAQNTRETDSDRYVLAANTIIRTARGGSKTKYLIGQLPPLTDFTVAHDNSALYLLAEHAVYSISL